MNTVILHWTPGVNWMNLSTLPYLIEDGICDGGLNDYHPWTMIEEKDIHEGDNFYVVATKTKRPRTQVYDYISWMGAQNCPISGVYFCGVVRGIEVGDDGKKKLDLGIQFCFLPGVLWSLELKTLKRKIPSVVWDKIGETILNEAEEKVFVELFSEWLHIHKSTLEGTAFSNIADRSIDNVKEIMSLV